MKITVKCDGCGNEFNRIKRDVIRYTSKGLKQYCSLECHTNSKRKLVSCRNCEIDFTTTKSSKAVFCSRKCSAIFNNTKTLKYCKHCNKILNSGKYFCNNTCSSTYKALQAIKQNVVSSFVVKKYLLDLHGKFCWKCKNSTWNGLPITLELEHKDGNSSNNVLDNLEILCPNCHSQTSTYKARNKGRGRHTRRERYKEGKSF